jgi:hypothetical protein
MRLQVIAESTTWSKALMRLHLESAIDKDGDAGAEAVCMIWATAVMSVSSSS